MVFTTKHVMYRVKESVFVTYLYAGIFNHPAVGIGMAGVLFIHRRKRQTNRQRCFAMNVNAM